MFYQMEQPKIATVIKKKKLLIDGTNSRFEYSIFTLDSITKTSQKALHCITQVFRKWLIL